MEKINQESKIMHEYAIGNLEDIKVGDLTKKDIYKTWDLEEAKSTYSQCSDDKSSLVLLPKIMGVYRRFRIEFFNPDAKEKGSIENRFDLEPKEGFDVHPSLVQIGYDPKLFQFRVINDYIGSETKRMVVVPYEQLKGAGPDLKKFSDLTSKRWDEETNGEKISPKDMKEYLFLIKNLLESEGLTNHDYNILKSQPSEILL